MTATPRRARGAARHDAVPAEPAAPSTLVGRPVLIRGVVAHAVEPDGAVCVATGRGFLWASREECGFAPGPAFAPDPDLFG